MPHVAYGTYFVLAWPLYTSRGGTYLGLSIQPNNKLKESFHAIQSHPTAQPFVVTLERVAR